MIVSEPDTPMIPLPDAFQDLLYDKKALAHLATLMADGSPHVTPVWFDVNEGKIRVNAVRGRVKARNMLRDARVCLSIADPGDANRYIHIRGRVIHVTEDGAVAHNNALTRKYLGLDVYPWDRPGDIHVLHEIEPLTVNDLASGKLPHELQQVTARRKLVKRHHSILLFLPILLTQQRFTQVGNKFEHWVPLAAKISGYLQLNAPFELNRFLGPVHGILLYD